MSLYSCRSMREYALVALLLALVAAVAAIAPSQPSLVKRPFTQPMLVQEGESIPYHPLEAHSEGNTLLEGITALGEWLQSVGLFEGEPRFIPTQPPAGEPLEIELEAGDTSAMHYTTLKRDQPVQAPASTPPSLIRACSGRGILMNKTGIVNKCTGYECEITSMVCAGIEYHSPYIYSYPGSMVDCQVKSLECKGWLEPVKVFPEACPIQKFNCPGRGTVDPLHLTGESMLGCNVQVYCPSDEGKRNVLYGYEAWDWECTKQELVCNGHVVTSPNGHLAENGTCSIRSTPCGMHAPAVTETCNTVRGLCSASPLENACLLKSIRGSADCDPSRPREYATIDKITCPDGTHDYSTMDGSIAPCKAIRSVVFRGVNYTLPYDDASNSSYCVLSELDCGGIRVPWNFTRRVPDGCGVARVICGESPPLTWPPPIVPPICTTYNFGCRLSETTCRYTSLMVPCRATCRQRGRGLLCDCPVDYTGQFCQTPRGFSCSYNITHANIIRAGTTSSVPYEWNGNCLKKLKKRQLGEPICYPMNDSDELTMHDTVTDFNYTVYAERFRVSNRSVAPFWKLWMKGINYNSFTDLSGSRPVLLSPEQMAGNDTISFTLKPSQLHPHFKPGGRLRLEWQFFSTSQSPPNLRQRVVYGATVDLMDWKPDYPKSGSKFSAKALTVAILSILAILVIALFIWRYIKKRQSNQIKL